MRLYKAISAISCRHRSHGVNEENAFRGKSIRAAKSLLPSGCSPASELCMLRSRGCITSGLSPRMCRPNAGPFNLLPQTGVRTKIRPDVRFDLTNRDDMFSNQVYRVDV